MKKILIAIVVLAILGVSYYGISPLFNNVEVDDALPESVGTEETTGEIVGEEETPTQESAAEPEPAPSGFEDLSKEDQDAMMEQMEESNKETPEAMEDEIDTSAKGAIEQVYEVMDTVGHPAEGTVRVIETADGSIARYENFSTINGPRLHVYLAKDLRATEFIDLGPIRGTKGNINYDIPEGTDLSEYRYLMYWCVPFGVLFNYADLAS